MENLKELGLVQMTNQELLAIDGGFVCGGICIGVAFLAGFAVGVAVHMM